jgi:outer membrane lipoprotein-sorting protein
MTRTSSLACLATCLLAFAALSRTSATPVAVPAEVREILGKIDAANRYSEVYSAALRIESHAPGAETSVCVYRLYSKGLKKALLVFVEPAKDAGKKIAMNGSSMWFYFPKARQSIIVRPVSSLTGSVSVGDTIGAPLLELYDFAAARPTEDGRGYILSFVAKKKESPYGKVEYEYRAGRIAGQSSFARSGALLKTIDFEEYADAGRGREYATRLKIANAVYPEYYSIISISDLKDRASIPDYYFTPEGLADAGASLR